MRIMLSICVGVVNTVHDTIDLRAHIRRPLRDERIDEKEFLPSLTHSKSAMRGIAVMKKTLGKQRQIPMENEKRNKKDHKGDK
jgi:hypothetical protein